MQHTPGPWQIERRGVHIGSAPMIMGRGWTGRERIIAKAFYHQGSEDPEVDGNAHLLAAAPDLYEALLALMDAVRIDAMREAALGRVLSNGFAALRKAGGFEDGSL